LTCIGRSFAASRLRTGPISAIILVAVLACEGVPIGKIAFGELQAHGSVDVDYLEAQMAPVEPRFQACYAQSLRRNHSTHGVIRLSLRGGGGKLIPSVVENTAKDERLGQCVANAIASLTLVEREGTPPWAFTAEWSVTFEIVKLPHRKREIP
jgi:hypothetical protein